MEKDEEFTNSSSHYDFGARIYDGRIGRWLAVDPDFKIYPSFSSYSFVSNSPLCFIDPTGKYIVYANDEQTQKMRAQIQVMREKSVLFDRLYTALEVMPAEVHIVVDDERVERVSERFTGHVEAFASKYSPDIVFRSTNGKETVSEELFHKYQLHLINGLNETNANLDSEAKLFRSAVVDEIGPELETQEWEGVPFALPDRSIALGALMSGDDALLIPLLILASDPVGTQTKIDSEEEIQAYQEYNTAFEYDHNKPGDPYKGDITLEKPEAYNSLANDEPIQRDNDNQESNIIEFWNLTEE